MFIRKIVKCPSFTAGDNTLLRELFNPLKDSLKVRYSLAHAAVKPGEITCRHKLKTSEVYYILRGKGTVYIDKENAEVEEGDAIYIPPESKQRIKNTGKENLVFLAIVDPAWRLEDEEIL
ncbi:cupin domain-containing protein [Candidatus Micrarchaeota archaeon]|nr:cupin domain-containing protein [Candidatus Micrarchaeota archaeon]MBU1929979.1 cupin domain-containing protein [Candidatus Micrarchaeota archaeon]